MTAFVEDTRELVAKRLFPRASWRGLVVCRSAPGIVLCPPRSRAAARGRRSQRPATVTEDRGAALTGRSNMPCSVIGSVTSSEVEDEPARSRRRTDLRAELLDEVGQFVRQPDGEIASLRELTLRMARGLERKKRDYDRPREPAELSPRKNGEMSDSIKHPWPWPPELDAMSAAPEHHTLLFENEYVRVLDAHVKPGDTVPVHTHCWPGVLYILGVSDFVRRDPDGNVILDTRGSSSHTPTASAVSGRSPHSSHA